MEVPPGVDTGCEVGHPISPPLVNVEDVIVHIQYRACKDVL